MCLFKELLTSKTHDIMKKIIRIEIDQYFPECWDVLSAKNVALTFGNQLMADKDHYVKIIGRGAWSKLCWKSALEEAQSYQLVNQNAFCFTAVLHRQDEAVNLSLLKYQRLYRLIYVPFRQYVYLVDERLVHDEPVANLAYALGFSKIKTESFMVENNYIASAVRNFKVTRRGSLVAFKDVLYYSENGTTFSKEFPAMYFAENSIMSAYLQEENKKLNHEEEQQ